MKKSTPLNLALAGCVIGLLAGCASTKVSDQNQSYTGFLPKPGNILVYDFAATPADVPADSAAANQPDVDTTPQTPEEIAEGKKLGAQIAADLAEEIRAMGMQAMEVPAGTQPQLNDIVLKGTLISVKQGSALKRFAIGFGSGNSEMTTLVEGYQETATGLRKLGSGTVNSGGSKGPGTAVGLGVFLATHNPAGLIISTGTKVYGEASGKSTIEGRAKATADEIAKVLKPKFQEQGWIAQ